MPVFTDALIRSAASTNGKRLEITDLRTPGLTLRVTANGAKSFAFVYRAGAGTRRVTLGRYPQLTLKTARAMADDCRNAVLDGREPAVTRPATRRAITFDTAADRYLEEYAKPRKRSWREDERYLARARARWGARDVRSITDLDAAALLDEMAATAPISANRAQATLHKMFKWLAEAGRRVVASNPFAAIPRRGQEKRKDRCLTDAELRTFWLGLRSPDLPAGRVVALALQFILTTMARPGEVAGAQWNEIQTHWHLPETRTKNKRPLIVPLSELAWEILAEARSGTNAVFPSRFGSRVSIARHTLSQALRGITLFLGIQPFTPHDLRRTAATLARRSGAPREGVEAMLNHTKRDVTAVYDRYDLLEEKRRTAEILAREIRRIVSAPNQPEEPAAPRAVAQLSP